MVNTKQHEEGFALESRIAELEAENRGVWREINLLREINALLDDENDDLTLLLDETRKVGIEEVRVLESENKLYEDALANYEQRCKGLEAERDRLRRFALRPEHHRAYATDAGFCVKGCRACAALEGDGDE